MPARITAATTRIATPGRRQDPAPDPDVGEEQQRADRSDHGQQLVAPQLRVHVGVRQARHDAALGVRQQVAVQPEPPRAQPDQQREQHRQVHVRGRRDALARGLRADASEHVVAHGRHQDGHEQRHEQPAVQPCEERQVEDEEADVEAEVRILEPPLATVEPQQHRAPPADRRRAREQPGQHRDDDHQQPRARGDELPVALDDLLLLGGQPVGRGQPDREPQVPADEQRGREEHHHRERGLRAQLAPQHLGEAERAEPQHVGVEGRDPGGEHHQDEDDRQQHEQPAAPLEQPHGVERAPRPVSASVGAARPPSGLHVVRVVAAQRHEEVARLDLCGRQHRSSSCSAGAQAV